MEEIGYCNDWVFRPDVKKTRDFYERGHSVVPPTLRERLPGVAAFLEQMGIDTQKPLNPAGMDGFDDLLYFAYGTAKTTTGYELDFYDEAEILRASIVVYCDIDHVKKYMWELPEQDTDILLFEIFTYFCSDE